jgi:FAD/FMN-containing dehydrogenase
VTRLTLRTHDLPEFVGAAIMTIEAKSDDAYRRLIGRIVAFYNEALFNPHWGEQIAFRPSNVLMINMTFQGLGQQQAQATWKPFLDWLAAAPQDFTMTRPPIIIALPARSFWDPGLLKMLPGVVIADDRPGAPAANVFWAATLGEAGWVLHGYQSAWAPASLLREGQQESLADALFAASRHWGFALHVNKGLAGAPPEAIEAAKDTAMNPAGLDAFALVISGAEGPPAYPGIAGHEPDVAAARAHAQAIEGAMSQLRKLAPSPGAYFAESNFFEETWRESFWGPNYAKLLAIKDKYDPDGLFFGHHGVGSERWSADGFTRLS